MLDDMPTLRGAVATYRAAATAAGVPWPDGGERAGWLSPEALRRTFDVDRIPEQAIWLNSEALPYERILPCGAHPLPWTDPAELLDYLSFAVATPFAWRHQLPMFFIDHVVFTFVLAGEHQGEVWRYQIDPDDWNPLRAAPSLAAMFTEWTKGFAVDVYQRSPYDTWLHIGADGREPVAALRERGLDPFAFPVHISVYDNGDLIRARQRECGVDIDRADSPEHQEELQDAISAARSSLHS
jgi:hypothetical protein